MVADVPDGLVGRSLYGVWRDRAAAATPCISAWLHYFAAARFNLGIGPMVHGHLGQHFCGFTECNWEWQLGGKMGIPAPAGGGPGVRGPDE